MEKTWDSVINLRILFEQFLPYLEDTLGPLTGVFIKTTIRTMLQQRQMENF